MAHQPGMLRMSCLALWVALTRAWRHLDQGRNPARVPHDYMLSPKEQDQPSWGRGAMTLKEALSHSHSHFPVVSCGFISASS